MLTQCPTRLPPSTVSALSARLSGIAGKLVWSLSTFGLSMLTCEAIRTNGDGNVGHRHPAVTVKQLLSNSRVTGEVLLASSLASAKRSRCSSCSELTVTR